MGLFNRKIAPVAPIVNDGPREGDDVWWRGMRMHVILGLFPKKDVARGLTRYTNGHYTCATLRSDLVWSSELHLWLAEGREGPMPKVVRGVITDPPLPLCDCGAVTWRRAPKDGESPLCTDCRLVLAAQS